MLVIPWTSLITNEELLRRIGNDSVLLLLNNKYELIQLIMEDKVKGKR